ncbi:MAG: ATP-binding protein [Pseudomonadales bacterium]|nr:ATP-binding protein [Pseudomonadales bacterium]
MQTNQLEPSQRCWELEQIFTLLADLNSCQQNSADLASYMLNIQPLISQLMASENLSLALCDAANTSVQYIFSVDEKEAFIDPKFRYPLLGTPTGPTEWVIANNQELIFENQYSQHPHVWRSVSVHWLGMPLSNIAGHCFGALVCQHYSSGKQFSAEQKRLFRSVSITVAAAVDKYSDRSNLKSILAQRNLMLEQKLRDKKRWEKLQLALLKIAALTNDKRELTDLYARSHQIIDELMTANNIGILSYDENRSQLIQEYFVDKVDSNLYSGVVIPFGEGMSSLVIKTRQAQLFTPQIARAKLQSGELKNILGNDSFTSWIGAPIMSASKVYGLIFVQSYAGEIPYAEQELHLLQFIASHLATAIQVKTQADQKLLSQRQSLQQQSSLEQKNKQINQSLQELSAAQQQLAEKQKMAALTGLVAGVAHEINTPLGICITCVSRLNDTNAQIRAALFDNSLSRQKLAVYNAQAESAQALIDTNMQRVVALLANFEGLSTQQSHKPPQQLLLGQYLKNVIANFAGRFSQRGQSIELHQEGEVQICTDVEALDKVLTNLLHNSLKHAYDQGQYGRVSIAVSCLAEQVTIRYKDDGKGMCQTDLDRLFDPFYTTKRNAGDSGLGAHHIYNLVTSALQGKIQVSSELGRGLSYVIHFPQSLQNIADRGLS